MSLTAHLIFNQPTRLPPGRMRVHFMEAPSDPHAGQILNDSIKGHNIERVFAAVAAGHGLVNDICSATRLSKTTVQKALNSLYTWPGGSRITFSVDRSIQGGSPYHWKAVK